MEDLGKIILKRDDFDKEYGDGDYLYEFSYHLPDIEDGSKNDLSIDSKQYIINQLVKKFAIKLRVNLLEESSSKFHEDSNLSDILSIDVADLKKQEVSENIEQSESSKVKQKEEVLSNNLEGAEKQKYEIQARIEFDIDTPFVIDSVNKNEAIKSVVKHCMEHFNIPGDAVVIKSALTEEEKSEREENQKKQENNV